MNGLGSDTKAYGLRKSIPFNHVVEKVDIWCVPQSKQRQTFDFLITFLGYLLALQCGVCSGGSYLQVRILYCPFHLAPSPPFNQGPPPPLWKRMRQENKNKEVETLPCIKNRKNIQKYFLHRFCFHTNSLQK